MLILAGRWQQWGATRCLLAHPMTTRAWWMPGWPIYTAPVAHYLRHLLIPPRRTVTCLATQYRRREAIGCLSARLRITRPPGRFFYLAPRHSLRDWWLK